MNTKNKWSSNRLRNFQIGILVALSTVFMAFEWTTTPPNYSSEAIWEEMLYEIPVVRTKHPSKEKKIPPPPVVTPKIDIEEPPGEYTKNPIIEDEKDGGLISKVSVDAPPTTEPPKPPTPAPFVEPVVEEVEKDKIHVRVEHMPLFTSRCSDLLTSTEKTTCSENAMMKFIYRHVKYPAIARESNIQGTVFVQFVIEKDGSVSNINVVRDIGGGCGREVERIVKLMPDWIPGRQGIHKVRVKYSLPVKFKLQ